MNINILKNTISNPLYENLLLDLYKIHGKEECLKLMQNLRNINNKLFLKFFNRCYEKRNFFQIKQYYGMTLTYGANDLHTKIYLINFIIKEDFLLKAKLNHSFPINKIFPKKVLNNFKINPISNKLEGTPLKIYSLEDLEDIYEISSLDLTLNFTPTFK